MSFNDQNLYPTLSKALRGLREDRQGAVSPFVLPIFLLMIIAMGVSVDILRHDQIRSQLQATLDRATLAAADLRQQLPPAEVVTDYVAKAGLSSQLGAIDVNATANSRRIAANGLYDMNPMFLRMLGFNDLPVRVLAQAEQNISNVELSLVLDVSGSMQGAKIENLKLAASEFVQTVLERDTRGLTSVTLVPYNGQVNLSPALASKFNLTDRSGVANANCVDLPASTYETTGLSRSLAMPQSAYVDSFSWTDMVDAYVGGGDVNATPIWQNRNCLDLPANHVSVASSSIQELQARINGLTAVGATSINAGLKWGVALLDPAMRGAYAELASAGQVPGAFASRPAAFDDRSTLKIVVLMTDGQHFPDERVNDGYRTGNSTIWRSNGDGEYSAFHAGRAGTDKFWVPHLGIWQATPWDSGAGTSQMTWQNLWLEHRMSWVAWQLYARALGTDDYSRDVVYSETMETFRHVVETSTMDRQLDQICDLAKGQNVIIYGIAFEAPAHGQEVIRNCASSPAHFFDARGLSISTAFRTIANNLSQLRLTQ